MTGGAATGVHDPDRTGTRTERDALGTWEVPVDALWGIHTARAVATLSHSGRTLAQVPGLATALAQVKAAAAEANRRAGVLEPEVAAAVVAAAEEVAAGRHDGALVADPLAGGGAIAVHANVDEVLANLASAALGGGLGTYEPVHPTAHVAASQSTADVVHTATRLAVLEGGEALDATLGALLAELHGVAERFGSAPTLARTCLQDGLAVEARLLFDGAAAAVERRRATLARALQPLHAVVLGSTVVGTGAGAPEPYRAAVVDLLAERSGRPLVRADVPASSLQHGDDLVEVSSALAQLGIVAAKVASDLRLLSSGPVGGFGEVALPAVMEGSAFFVDKVNPAVPETVVQAVVQVDGLHRAVLSAAARAELHLHPYDLAAGVGVLDQVSVLDRALHALARHALPGLVLDHDRSQQLAAAARSTKVGP